MRPSSVSAISARRRRSVSSAAFHIATYASITASIVDMSELSYRILSRHYPGPYSSELPSLCAHTRTIHDPCGRVLGPRRRMSGQQAGAELASKELRRRREGEAAACDEVPGAHDG